MLQLVTTKPGKKYRSIRKPRVYEALRKRGYSKQSAARISNAQAHKSYTLAQLEAFVSSPHYDPTTAAAIAANVPALPSLKGEQISPGVTRIHGNLCNVHGRYGPCDAALGAGAGAAKPPKPRKGRKPRQPAKTEAQRAAERTDRQAVRQQELSKQQALNLTKVGDATDLGDHLANLNQFSQGKPLRPQDTDELVKRGLLEIGSDGTPRQTEQAHVLLNAAKRGDTQGARDAASRAQDRVKQGQDRASARAERTQAAAARHAEVVARQQARLAKQQARAAGKKPSGGGKGGGKNPTHVPPAPRAAAPPKKAPKLSAPASHAPFTAAPPPKAAKPTKAQTTASNRAAVRDAMAQADQGLAPGGFDNLIALGGGTEPDTIGATGLIGMGMAERGADGTLRLTSAGRQAIAAANRGDAKAAIDVISRASEKKMTTKAAGNPGDYLIVEDPAKSTTWHLQVKRGGEPDHGLMGSAWAALHSGFRGNVYQGPQKGAALAKLKKLYASENMPLPTTKESSFRVFKDATGNMRWVAQSSTAFQDRDQEIVSTKALADDCAFADSTGQYGPLRWWHTPGLELGDCDFNAMHGRVLIESGTFRSPAIAQKVAASDGLEISIGFLHLPTEPDASGVFHHIRRFERSLVPRGKASNRFTAFSVKETIPMDETKIAYLRTELKFSDAEIAEIQATAAATEKAADEQQVAYKADEPEYPDVVLNGITYKAFPPKAAAASAPIEGSSEEEAAESPEEAAAEPDAGMDDGSGLTLSPEDISAIGQAVSDALTTALGPLVSTMDLTNKIGNHMNDLKTMMGGYTAKKDATDAERAEQIASLQTSLKDTQSKLDELLGLQPAVAPRASEAPSSIVNPFNPADNKLLQAIKDQVAPDQLPQYSNEFEDLKLKLFGP